MKSVIYIIDDFPETEHKKWWYYGREAIYSYAKKINVPIVNFNKQNHLFKKFKPIFEKVSTEVERNRYNQFYIMKTLRHHLFLESDYDYAFFLDLDYILTNPSLNILDLVNEDTLYINAYNHECNGKIVPHQFAGKSSPRYHMLKFFRPDSDDDKLLNVSTGFMAFGKQIANDIMKFYDDNNINPITEDGLRKISNIDYPACLDEALMNVAIDNLDLKFELANKSKLCDEGYFYYADEPSVFWHVVGRDHFWTKDKAYHMLNYFFNYFGENKND